MNDMPHNKKEQRGQMLRAFSLFSQIGITMATCVLVGVILGRLLDDALGTSPWLPLLFSLLGAGASFKALYDLLQNK